MAEESLIDLPLTTWQMRACRNMDAYDDHLRQCNWMSHRSLLVWRSTRLFLLLVASLLLAGCHFGNDTDASDGRTLVSITVLPASNPPL